MIRKINNWCIGLTIIGAIWGMINVGLLHFGIYHPILEQSIRILIPVVVISAVIFYISWIGLILQIRNNRKK